MRYALIMTQTGLVIGGAGVTGSCVAAASLRHGRTGHASDRFSNGSRRYERTHAVTAGIDCMVNLVALLSMPHSVQDPLTHNEFNVVSALSVVSAARFAGTQRAVMASFSRVCGCAREIPERERLLLSSSCPAGVVTAPSAGASRPDRCTAFRESRSVEGPKVDERTSSDIGLFEVCHPSACGDVSVAVGLVLGSKR